MTDTRFPVTLAGAVPVVTAPEEVDVSNAGQLRAALLEAVCRNPVLVADMSRTRFCDCAGLQALARARGRARDQNGEVILVAADAGVLRALELTGIGRLIPRTATLDEALALARAADGAGRRPQAARPDPCAP